MAPTVSTILASIFAREEVKEYHAFPWVIARNDGSTEGCPSRTKILVTFAVVNILMAIFAVIAGHRKVVNKATFGVLGKESKFKAYNFMWITTVGLNLAASATNAFIMKNTKGYGERFDVGQVMLFYTTRPRITWIFAGLLTSPFANQRENGPHWSDGWVSFAYSQVFAEIALQAISIYTLITANQFRHQQTRDGVHVPEGTPISKMRLGLAETLIGSFGWIIMFGLTVAMVLAVFTFKRASIRKVRDWCFLAVVITLACNWLFWDGYLREFPREYCPPKLTLQGAVWAIFTAVGIPLGVGF